MVGCDRGDEVVIFTRRWRRLLVVVAAALLLAVVAAGLWLHGRLEASLPRLDGTMALAGLVQPVTVLRDELGVPTVIAANRLDAARATGFLHAQDRFFQMDLMRRSAAGELAELFGPGAVAWDREVLAHSFRRVAEASVAGLDASERRLLEAYAEGVNAGLGALAAPPFEYLLLRSVPVPWRAEDTVLVVHAMFLDLQAGDGGQEAALGLVHALLPEAWFRCLAPVGGPWDAPVEGTALSPPPLPAGRPPGPVAGASGDEGDEPAGPTGSNSWAVAGKLSHHGGAILANDMHLGLRVPNTWYRARLEWQDAGTDLAVTGVTLPGTPLVVVGSSGRVAWGFTNSYGDFSDLIVLEVDPDDPERYRGPDGWQRLERRQEIVRVRGGGEETVEVVRSAWGPVIGRDPRGRPFALRWTAHSPEAVNLKAVGLEQARTVDEALAVAASSGIPAQNFLCADIEGRIGWTVMGRIPLRDGCDGRLPAGDECRWQGWLPAAAAPRIVDPPDGRLWTANARVVGGDDLAVLGDGGYDLGARAAQIRDALRDRDRFSEEEMLAIQLDDRALFLAPWQELLIELLDEAAVADRPLRVRARRLIEAWGGRAAIDSVGYRLVREFRRRLHGELLGSYLAAVTAADPDFRTWRLGQAEGAVWRLVSERPAELLPETAASWEALMLAVFDRTVEDLVEHAGSLERATWGARNTVRIRHPLSGALPLVSRWLDMPPVELPGDAFMPRVQAPSFGASERMVVSPGYEERGIFHMPGGQCGHPLSPFYRAGHEAWVRGEATPFLPGVARHELRLAPPPAR